MLIKTLQANLNTYQYPIYIGGDLIHDTNILKKHIDKQCFIITNSTIADLYLNKINNDLKADSYILPDGEKYKDIFHANLIIDELVKKQHDRSTTLIALGGGVIGDITGFVASIYQRGVSFIQIPTSLLAQVDASIGGKTAVNHPLSKNMIGTFYQPKAVIVDIEFLKTLPQKEYIAGLAEVIKYGLICDAEFFHWCEANYEKLLKRNEEALLYAIEKSVRTKVSIVEKDVTDQNQRQLLNFGHTFGHAIESSMNYENILHGEAVAIGMLMAIDMSIANGYLAEDVYQRVRALLENFSLPVSLPQNITRESLEKFMLHDKKIASGKKRFVLLKKIGEAFVFEG